MGWSKTGRIINPLFCIWFQNFVEFSGARKESPAVFQDKHGSHTRNLQPVGTAKEHGVMLLCFPQFTHRLPFLEVSFMKPVACVMQRKCEAGPVFTQGKWLLFSYLQFLGRADTIVADVCTIGNGLRLNGIWPPHRNTRRVQNKIKLLV
jgi:hypothetical protein